MFYTGVRRCGVDGVADVTVGVDGVFLPVYIGVPSTGCLLTDTVTPSARRPKKSCRSLRFSPDNRWCYVQFVTSSVSRELTRHPCTHRQTHRHSYRHRQTHVRKHMHARAALAFLVEAHACLCWPLWRVIPWVVPTAVPVGTCNESRMDRARHTLPSPRGADGSKL